jgi:hypothetical protein
MCRNSKTLIYGRHKVEKKLLICDVDCKTWACEDCADKMRRLHQLRIIEGCGVTLGGDWCFLTITSHEKMRGYEATRKNLQEGMRKLFERMRRKNGSRHYILIHEYHADGVSLHIHMLYNCFVDERWLKDNARECGMGFEVKSELLRDPKSSGKYVTKYLSKAIEQGDLFPKRFKRVRYSVGFPRFEFPEKESDYVWSSIEKTREALQTLVKWHRHLGYEVKKLAQSLDSDTDKL